VAGEGAVGVGMGGEDVRQETQACGIK